MYFSVLFNGFKQYLGYIIDTKESRSLVSCPKSVIITNQFCFFSIHRSVFVGLKPNEALRHLPAASCIVVNKRRLDSIFSKH